MRYLKLKAWNFQKGFTLIELLVVVALVTVIGLTSVPFYSRFFTQNAVGNTYDQLQSQFRKAQTYAMIGKQNGPWGVHNQAGNMILFQGNTYASRKTAFDEKFAVNSNVSITGFTDIIFSKMTGTPSAAATITIQGNNTTKTITLSAQGIANPANAPASIPTLTPIPNLVGYWKFDEGAGTTAQDTSGKGNIGTLVNSPAWVPGKIGQALQFSDATNSYVDVGNPASLQISGDMTVLAWVNGDYVGYSRTIVGNDASNAPNRGWRFYIEGTYNPGALQASFDISADGTNYFFTSGSSLLSNNTWYHVASVYKAGSFVRSYLNGVLDGEVTAGVPAAIYASNAGVKIGTRTNGINFNGTIDDVRIYNRVLSAAEIQAIYNGVP